MSSDNLILNLLVTGKSSLTDNDDDDNPDKTIKILTLAAQNEPRVLLKAVNDVIEVRIDTMVMLALAILTAKADESFLEKEEISEMIIMFLSVSGPPKLLEYVEYLKSKSFGRGFGSRPQKWVRSVMEDWKIDHLKNFNQKNLYSLVRLVHPRYTGFRGKFIKEVMTRKIK
jgi:hypothetical protein